MDCCLFLGDSSTFAFKTRHLGLAAEEVQEIQLTEACHVQEHHRCVRYYIGNPKVLQDEMRNSPEGLGSNG